MQKILFLYNPHAGKGKIKEVLSDIIEVFVNADYEITIHSTKGRGDARDIARERGESYDIIVACGGDGTLNEVVNGVMQLDKKPNIGFIPAGTTNDFAMNLKIPKTQPDAAKTITIGKPYAYDIGSFNGQYFNYVASFGVFTAVSYSTSQTLKNLLGRIAYLIEGAKSLTYINSYKLKLTCGEHEIEDEFIFGSISNANSIGGFKNVAGKNVTLDDGLFEVILVTKPKTIFEFRNIINALLTMDFSNCDNIFKFKANEIVIHSEKIIDWTLDGEYGGSLKQVEIINHPHAINFLVDADIITEMKNEKEQVIDERYNEEVLTSIDESKFYEMMKNYFLLDKDEDDANEDKTAVEEEETPDL